MGAAGGVYQMAEAVYGRGTSLGLAPCTALVVGTMVGSGFYRAPSAWRPLASWRSLIAVGASAVCLGLLTAPLPRGRGEWEARTVWPTGMLPGCG